MAQGALPGFRDFYPPDFAERAFIFETWRRVARRYGFVEYDGPPLEPLELYTRKSGEEIVGQLYAFEDKGGRHISLRPEMTPSLARMVAARANALRKPVRWFSIPQLFRYERQQKGRLREHFQLNVDILGEPDVTADAELLAVAVDIMRELGLGPAEVRARVSDRRLLQAMLTWRGVTEAQLPAVFAVVDKADREPRESLERKLAEAGVSPAASDGIFAALVPRDLPSLREAFADAPAMAPHLDRLERYLGYLTALGVREYVSIDLSIVRGLAYYTGIVFELFDAKGVFRAICGGGRYDTLLDALGGVDMPALGFGMGDVVLGELLRERGLMPAAAAALDVWVAPAAASVLAEAMRLATALRRHDLSVEYAIREQSMSKQLKAAHAAGARYFVEMRGAHEGEVFALAGGRSQARALSELETVLQSALRGPALIAHMDERFPGASQPTVGVNETTHG